MSAVIKYLLAALGPEIIEYIIDLIIKWLKAQKKLSEAEPTPVEDEVKKKPSSGRFQSAEDGPFRNI